MLLVHGEVQASVHGHANLVKTIFVGRNVHLLTIRQASLNAAILVETEELTDVAILAIRPALVLLVEYEV